MYYNFEINYKKNGQNIKNIYPCSDMNQMLANICVVRVFENIRYKEALGFENSLDQEEAVDIRGNKVSCIRFKKLNKISLIEFKEFHRCL